MGITELALAVGLKAGLKAGSTSLTYSRAGSDPVTLTGTQGKKKFRIQEPGQPVVIVESVDFLILVADLMIDSALTEPLRDDEISRVQGSTKFIYKVLPFAREIPFFEYSDTGKTVYRIHTKLFSQEAV